MVRLLGQVPWGAVPRSGADVGPELPIGVRHVIDTAKLEAGELPRRYTRAGKVSEKLAQAVHREAEPQQRKQPWH